MKKVILFLFAPLFLMAPGVLGAPSGQITADPEVVFVPSGGHGKTLISWTTTNCANAQVTVQSDGGEEQDFGDTTSSQGSPAPWIGLSSFTFRLYGDLTRTLLLDSIEVTGTASPLTVQPKGRLYLENRPYRGLGVNYFDAFNRVLWDRNDTSYEEGFEKLAEFGIPFARMDLSGYQPIYADLFFTNRAEYFRCLDAVVASAERHGVGLIPSFFWTTFTFSDLAGEHLDQVAVASSLTRQKMREFTAEIVKRYKHSRAIWAWEFGNEWNLMVDLPNGELFLPPTWTDLGNPATRDVVRDQLSTEIILPAMQDFADLVSSLDPGRPVSSGHSIPRTAAWHMDQWRRGLLDINHAWTTDSEAQAREIALRQCPAPYNLLSIHNYVISEDVARVAQYAQFAAEAGKALFVGEFGAFTPAEYNEFLAASREAPLAAMWCYDRVGEAAYDGMNATLTNSRRWMLEAVLPATFEGWSRGWGASETPGDDQTAFGQYVFGAALPGGAVPPSNGGMSNEFLELTAVVRTNDPALSVFGQTAAELLPEGWSSAGVQQADFSDQTNVLPGCVRRTFRIPVSSDSRKFLRIRAEGP